MLTGDSRRTAEAVAAKLGLTHVETEVLPERKIEVVRELRARDAGSPCSIRGQGYR
jgi:cation transport ATPase